MLALPQLIQNSLQTLAVNIIEHEPSAFAGKEQGSSAADAACCAGDDDDFVSKPHGSPPLYRKSSMRRSCAHRNYRRVCKASTTGSMIRR